MSEDFVVEHTEDAVASIDEDERLALEDADIDIDAIVEKTYSYRMLLDEDVPESIAHDIRRRFSLPWSFEHDGDLDERSTVLRGLGDAERKWIAASADESWQAFENARSRAEHNETDETVERPWPRPTPVTDVTGVSPDHAAHLAEAGINSAERLATINADAVADVLELDVRLVRHWRSMARNVLD